MTKPEKERLNWREACDFLGCSKSTLYRTVYEGRLRAYGIAARNRFFMRSDCEELLKRTKTEEDS